MELSNNNIRKLVEELHKKVEKKTSDTLDALCNDVVKTTQRNFNSVIDEVPADDPFVYVSQTPTFVLNKSTIGRKIECKGNQVLFIEFGAGKHEEQRTSTFDKSSQLEYATRPKGIYPIGHYKSQTTQADLDNWQKVRMSSMSRGMDDYWFYSSKTGRGSTNAEQIRYNKKGTYTMLTIGIRPVRALYRALGTSFRKLGSGRLKIK